MEKKKRLLIIDSNSLLHRAFHALPPLKTKKGELVNAVYGFCLLFLKALKEIKPDFIVATFDLPGPTFRHQEFKAYKAKRPKVPEEIYQQVPKVKEVLKSFEVPIFEKEGFEADDLIGTITQLGRREQIYPKIETIILSGDLDTLQLVDAQTQVYTMRKGIKDTILYDVKGVEEKYQGLRPSQLTDFKGLRGDPSDNIPGVTGIGEKTAISLLKEFGSLENLYSTLNQRPLPKAVLININQRLRAKLEAYKDQAFFSKKLAQLKTNIPLDFKLKDCQFNFSSKGKVAQVFRDLEFYTLLKRLSEENFLNSTTAVVKIRKEEVGEERLREYEEIERLYQEGVFSKKIADIEKKLVPVIKKMGQNGIKIDLDCLEKLSRISENKLKDLATKIYKLSSDQFNINSPSQLAEVLFEKLKISSQGLKRTPTGVISTGASQLSKLKNLHPIINLILEYRELFKLKSGFVDALPHMVSPKDGRIHSQFYQFGTTTGRISCLSAGSLVNTQQGLVGIECVRVGEFIRTSCGLRKVLDWQATGKKPVVVLTFSNGITLRCSPDHRLRSKNEWVRAIDIKVGMPAYMSFTEGIFGDQVALNLNYPAKYRTKKTSILPKTWTEDLAELIGYILADGHISKSNYKGKPTRVVLAFGWDDEYLISHFKRIIEGVFGKSGVRRITKICLTLEVSGVDIEGCVEQLGVRGLSGNIRVPPSLFCAPENIVAAFLRGYFEGDGYVGDDQISVRSVSLSMFKDVQQLLTLFGIPSSISKDSADPRSYARRYTLRIVGDRSKQSFCDRIGFLSAGKQEACKKSVMVSNKRTPAELLTFPNNLNLESIKPQLYFVQRDIKQRVPQALNVFMPKFVAGHQTITLQGAEWIINSLLNEELRQRISFLDEAVKGQYYEVTVTKISHEPAVPMYDISVEEVEQYIAQGIIVHNSSKPNLQNIPIKSELGNSIRRCFVPAAGFKFLSADYSQMELRLAAVLSQDKKMQELFQKGQDFHKLIAQQLFGVKEEEVSVKIRDIAKTLNYGILYGMGAQGLSQRTGLSLAESKKFISQYFKKFSGLSKYIEKFLKSAREKGFAQTIFGRKRFLKEINSIDPRIRAQAERIAVNLPTQGTSADIVKMAMVEIDSRIKSEFGSKAEQIVKMVLQIHDELLFEVKEDKIKEIAPKIKEIMENVAKTVAPLKVELKVGKNWGELENLS
ncbi:MAG: DNA polymerase [Patescibacteria group bacterium]|nr:DNA polymerase [Patescibacteria group bacterium]